VAAVAAAAAQAVLVEVVQAKQAMVVQGLNPVAVHKVPAARPQVLAVQHQVLL